MADGQAFIESQEARNDADYHNVKFDGRRVGPTMAKAEALRKRLIEVLDG